MITKTFTFEGKRYYVRAKTDKEAEIKRALRIKELEDGKREISKNMTVSAWCVEWLETYKEPSVNSRHYKNIQGIVRNFIEPSIGHLQLKKIKPVHLQKILNDVSGYSSSYVSKIFDVIKQIFTEAYRNSLITYNPTEGLKKPTGSKNKQRRAITDKERELTLKVAEYHRGGLFVLIMLYCGLRPGEVAALQWNNIDLDKRIIHVTRALKSDNTINLPKTSSGIRDVPVPDVLLTRLKAEHKGPFDLVCTNSYGNHYTESSIQAMWESFRNQLNIVAGCKVFRNQVQPPYAIAQDLTLYCYRHTYCTDLQAAGVPINVAKEFMGHSSISVTAQIYTHKSDVAFNNAAMLINNYVSSGVAPNAETIEISMNK